MGTQFANVVTLVVAGEIFAKGLTTIGTVDAVIRVPEHSGLGGIGVMIIMALVIAICAIVMGSGNAPFMSFAQSYSEYRSRITCTSGCNQLCRCILPRH